MSEHIVRCNTTVSIRAHHTVPHNCGQNYPTPGNATAKTSIQMTVLEKSAGEQETKPLFSRQRRDCLQGSLSSHYIYVICLRGNGALGHCIP